MTVVGSGAGGSTTSWHLRRLPEDRSPRQVYVAMPPSIQMVPGVWKHKSVRRLAIGELGPLYSDAEEAKFFNDTVQVYSKEAVFYVNERPEIIDAFELREHRQYDYNNSIERLISMIP